MRLRKTISYKISKWYHFQPDLGNLNSATNDRIIFHLCSYSKFASPIILNFTKIKPLKSNKNVFLLHLNCSFGSCHVRFRRKLGSWKWNNYEIMKRIAKITNLIFGKTQKPFWTKGSKMVSWRTTKEKNFWTYLAILKSSSWHFLRLSSKTKNKFRFSGDFWYSSCKISHFQRVSWMHWLCFQLLTKVRVSTVD